MLNKKIGKVLLAIGVLFSITSCGNVIKAPSDGLFFEISYEKYNKLAEKERTNPNTNIELRYVRNHGSTDKAYGTKIDYAGEREKIEYYKVNEETGAIEVAEDSTKQYISYAKKTLSTTYEDSSYTYYKTISGKFKYITVDNDSEYSQTRYTAIYNKYGKITYYSYESWVQNSTSSGSTYYYYQCEQYYVTWSK